MDAATAAMTKFPRSRRSAALDIAVWLGALFLFTGAILALQRLVSTGTLFTRTAPPVQMLIMFAVATALLRMRGEGWRSVGLRRPPSIRRVAALVVGGYVGIIAVNAVLVLVVFPMLGVALPKFGALGQIHGHPLAYAYWLAMAWIYAALGEELQVRGFLWSRLQRLFGPGRLATATTLVSQAALFSLGHIYQGLGGVLVTGLVGLVLGAVFLAGRRNLVACILLHALVDTVSLTAMFLGVVPPSVAG
jgi:membrane protease YdiL (CAAX protease family)